MMTVSPNSNAEATGQNKLLSAFIICFSIILNDVYIGDNTHIENCIVESRATIKPDTTYVGEEGNLKIVVEKSDRFIM